MNLESLSPIGATSSATAQSSLNKLGGDYTSFLKLLTAQISNQDPLEPMDSSTFVTQLAQLSQVEQAVAQNTNLESIATQLTNLGALSGMALIGRDVIAPSETAELGPEGSEIGYRVAGEASSVTLAIRDASGTIVRQLSELPGEGEKLHRVTWDGRDLSGTALPEGAYSISVEALDAEGNVVTAQSYATSTVKRMSFENGIATLVLSNGDSIAAGLIEAVS